MAEKYTMSSKSIMFNIYQEVHHVHHIYIYIHNVYNIHNIKHVNHANGSNLANDEFKDTRAFFVYVFKISKRACFTFVSLGGALS